MCSATDGATPVKRCTCAASATFSNGFRGTPGWLNTLNRVPELPKAQDGNSMRCRASTDLTESGSTMEYLLSSDTSSGSYSDGYVDEFDAEQVRSGAEVRPEVADAERPVVGDAGGAPGVGPLAGVAPEVDSRRRVPDLQQRTGHDRAARGDEAEAAIALLGQAEQGHRAVLDVELDRDAPAAFAVIDPEPPQEGAPRTDREVRGTVVPHLHHAVAEVERLQF